MMECPLPIKKYPQIVMAHGGGGRLSRELYENIFYPAFNHPELDRAHDGAFLKTLGTSLAFTTDSFVVRPLFFPGGDIGHLAVYGTTNDLAMCGARPEYLSLAFIIEEGFAIETLWKIVNSIKQAADEVGVQIVTGDTKVVERGKADGLYITSTGVGSCYENWKISPSEIKEGDLILLSGDLGRHGMAVMSLREGLNFSTDLKSDCASLSCVVSRLWEKGIPVHSLRDLTRGGLVSALVETAESAGIDIEIQESLIPVNEDVQGACEILGLDPMHVANEGRFIAFIPPQYKEQALDVLKSFAVSKEALFIGSVTKTESLVPKRGKVLMKTRFGSLRVLDMMSGEQLPRIC